MRDCVGVANSSSPSENSARHTFQDRAYLGGRIVRKRTKKSGIIYCLVTSHPPRRGEGNKQADSRLPNPQFLVPGRGGRIRGNSGFPGPDPRFPQTRPIRGLGRKRPNSSLENRPPIFVLFGKSVNFPLAGRPISLVARQNSVQTGVFRCEIPLSIWRPMQTCVGTAKTSSPTENSARHTFQDRAYPYGRNARKRTKKSGIIYCLVTSHPW